MTLLLWIILAVMTAATLVAILRPLARAAADPGDAPGHDAIVYREQLREIEADVARGQIDAAEAAAARAEIARRLIAAGAESPAPGSVPRDCAAVARSRNAVALAMLVAVPLTALGLYVNLGAPWLAGAPAAVNGVSVPADDIAALIAKVEERLKTHPGDGRGWDVIAPVYLRQGRYAEAALAFEKAVLLLGESARRLEGLGEARVLAAGGEVTAAARVALEKARAIDPQLVKPRFLLAMADEQAGQAGRAATAYKALLDDLPGDSPWRAQITARIQALASAAGAPSFAPGPTQDDIAAAAAMSEADRAAMINAMISRLAERLHANDQDRDGWLRLIRALSVMGRKEDALKALGDARRALRTDAEAGAALTALARELGLES